MHTDTEPLPADLSTPAREPWDASALAGVITGGVLLAICVVGLIYALNL